MEFELSHHAARRMHQRKIQAAWIEQTLVEPDRHENDLVDPTIHHALKRIAEMDDRILRVIYDPKCIPIRVISVYFDRGMKGKL